MSSDQPLVIEALSSVDLPTRRLKVEVYDNEIGIQLLYEDPDSGAEHYLVQYPPGLKAKWHRHPSAHAIVVLEGSMHVNDRTIGPGSYCHYPAGVPMWHAPAGDGGCLFLILFDGPAEVSLADEKARAPKRGSPSDRGT